MFSHKHYVPVLKCKSADIWSLQMLHSSAKGMITPIIEMMPPTEKQTDKGRLESSAIQLEKAWGSGTFMVDLIWRSSVPNLPAPDGRNLLTVFTEVARKRGLRPVPVTDPDRSPAFQAAVLAANQTDGRGMAVRLKPKHLQGADVMARVMTGLQRVTGVLPGQTDIVVDFEHLGNVAPALIPQIMRAAIATIPTPKEWRTLTVLAGTFPASITAFERSKWTSLTRAEWHGWNTLVTEGNPPSRLPAYGDYAVSPPGLPYSGHAKHSVNLRYSTATDFFVWRGEVADTHALGNGQIFEICSDLVSRREYAGEHFSTGDSEIQLRATTRSSPGNADSWRRWATNHYLELVASQIANHPLL